MTNRQWQLPDLGEVLDAPAAEIDGIAARQQSHTIERSLADFGVAVQVRNIHHGPRLTQFSLKPQSEVQISQIKRLEPDLAVALAGALIQIEEPRPDYPYITLVVQNYQAPLVKLRRVLESPLFSRGPGELKVPLGIDTFGRPTFIDLAAMPHLLLGGTTGSGKSTCLHAMIAALLCSHTPNRLQLLLIDPLEVEMDRYHGLPHLVAPVVTRTDRVLELLAWVIEEIDRRYRALAASQARDIVTYNQAIPEGQTQLPYIVIIIDNLFDLMLNAPKEVEQHLTRIAQKARGAGIHLVLATLRSNVSTISGSIKANFPGRIAFRVADRADSQLILDTGGAETLLGQGDMLFKSPHSGRLERIQGIYVSEQELKRLIAYWRGAKARS